MQSRSVRTGDVSRIVRDLDDEGRLIWIPDSKTEAGKRTLQVPEFLRTYLLALALAKGKRSEDLLFGYHDRNWPRKWVVTAREQLSRYDGLVGFRLTALGYCLGTRRTAPERAMTAVVGFRVTPYLRIRVAGDPASADRLVLDVCAVAADSGSWRLDRTRILEAVASGRPVARVREFLRRRTGAPLPAKVETFLAECEARARAVKRLGQARLLECLDRGTADEIASDPRTSKHCLRAGERILAVPAESEAAFTRALRNVGYGIRGEERGDVVS